MDNVTVFDMSMVLDLLPNAIFIKDENLRFVFVNTAYEKMFGAQREDVLGKSVLEVAYLPEEERKMYQADDLATLETQVFKHYISSYRFADGKMHTCLHWSGGFTGANNVRGFLGVIVDITEQSRTIGTLRSQLNSMLNRVRLADERSLKDSLTQLRTRKYLDLVLDRYAKVEKRPFCCVMLDVDRFKDINDTFGHLAGDSVLREVGAAIRQCAHRDDIICRYGGDEFVILLPNRGLKNAVPTAEKIRNAVAANVFRPDGKPVSVSLGCSEHSGHGDGLQTLHEADKALYAAKQAGRNRVCAGLEW
ncbi:diguanylate cyclase [Desulfovibrio sp. 86]|uniref:diguanylate cyclase n=1 Tax=uncultured Desulfovibrio sp. TaxID=167968 RepID=A0A212L6B3_9BACT|nr:diguanylate cyclase [Desulfovibrio sp. 86]SCM72879.1 Diguanylate cyclase with PAS/PAC sensor [uncultured Desulfovibrio sp.]VZH33800.1 Diguanylate cyclase with PAS/PAC sensor [Desulfovibrio sp. 86]